MSLPGRKPYGPVGQSGANSPLFFARTPSTASLTRAAYAFNAPLSKAVRTMDALRERQAA